MLKTHLKGYSCGGMNKADPRSAQTALQVDHSCYIQNLSILPNPISPPHKLKLGQSQHEARVHSLEVPWSPR